MAVLLTFLLGIGNFAMHAAVLRSGHPMVSYLPPALRRHGGRGSLAVEFAVLLVALLLTASASGWAWLYAAYTAANGAAAWLLLSGRL